MLVFTPAEKRAILFVVITLIVGTGVLSYQKYNPEFAPELLRGSSDSKQFKSYSNQVTSSNAERNKNVAGSNPNVIQPLAKINLNTATQEELQNLPFIGPVLAKRIIDYRYEKGGFSRVEELLEVKGIGKKNLAVIRDYLILE